MYYQNLIHDFATRTRENLETLRRSHANGPTYEVTQLINSLLGLLVFPQQEFVDEIPKTTISELEAGGWPIPMVPAPFEQVSNLQELIKYLRNAVAHFNLKFTSDDRDQISGIRMWNVDMRKKQTNWAADITPTELEQFIVRFIDLVLSAHPKK